MISIKLCDLLADGLAEKVAEDYLITGIVTDNRDVQAGDLFIALAGAHHHGRQFIDDAIQRGCSAVLVETDVLTAEEKSTPVPVISVPQLKNSLPGLLAKFYQAVEFNKANMIGVTGTNGKSSIVRFITQLAAANHKTAGIMGTLGFGIWPEINSSKNTTPEQAVLLRQVNQMQNQGAEVIAMEVSSHGIAEKRIQGVNFDTAIFCNLSQDHLDFHGDMEAYYLTKRELFLGQDLRYAIVNADDEYGQRLLADKGVGAQKISYGIASYSAVSAPNVWAKHYQVTTSGIEADIVTPWGEASVNVSLMGDFNLSNVLAAIAALMVTGQFELKELTAKLDQLSAPAGRMEMYRPATSEAPVALIDFAHTPDALHHVLTALNAHKVGELAVVFGCGGDRDNSKRALMGSVAELADKIWLTSDNPRSENVEDIIKMIQRGIKNTETFVEVDRQVAIEHAIARLTSEDLLLIAGKGHEDYQEVRGHKMPYSDQTVLFSAGYQLAVGGMQ